MFINHISSIVTNSVISSYLAVGLSDYYIQCVDYEVSICPQEVRTMWIYSFRKCDWDKLREALSYAPWHVISTFDDIDDQWKMFHSLLLHSLNAFALFYIRSPPQGLKGILHWVLIVLLLK